MSTDKPKKTGKKSWRPAKMLHTLDEEPGYRYRWCDKDTANLDKKQAEGWTFCKSKHVKPDASLAAPTDLDGAGNSLTSITEYRELVRMRLDEDTAEARDEYYAAAARRQEATTLKDRVREMAAAARMKVPPLETID